MWKGFRTTDVRINHQVTFVRRLGASQVAHDDPAQLLREPVDGTDLILIGCVKSKLGHPAPAKDLYTSALFRKERAYAESSGKPWFILSAKHGLVSPDEVIEPYDVYLNTMPAAYRAWWGHTVVDQLRVLLGALAGVSIEIHAGAAYVDQIRPPLSIDGARVVARSKGSRRVEAWLGTAEGSLLSPMWRARRNLAGAGPYLRTQLYVR